MLDTIDPVLTDQPLPLDVPAPAAAPAGAMASPGKRPPRPDDDPAAAPHGWTWDAKQNAWRPRKAAGRPRSVPRIQSAPAAAPAAPRKAAKPAAPPVDYRQTIMDTAEATWLGLSTMPIPDKAFGYDLSGIRLRVRMQAAVLQQTAPGFAEGLATVAEHAPKSFIARGLQRLAAGEGGLWVLPTAMLIAPLLVQTAAVWTANLDSDAEQLAAEVEAAGRDYLKQMGEALAGKMAQAAQQAQAGAPDPEMAAA